MGYTDVHCFKGGIPEWRAFNYPMTVNEDYAAIKVRKASPQELYELLQQDGSIYVLDVRPIDCERDNIFIKDAAICPMVYLSSWYINIPKDKKIVVTDWINKKSILAAKFLISKGYSVLGILKGGIVRWHQEGLPVVHREHSVTHDPALCRD